MSANFRSATLSTSFVGMGLCVLAGVLLRDDAWIAVTGIVLAADAIVGVAVGRLADASQRDRVVAPVTAQSMRTIAAFSCFFSALGVGIAVVAIGPGWRDYGALWQSTMRVSPGRSR